MESQTESIIDFAFRKALKESNIGIIKQCLAGHVSIKKKNISSYRVTSNAYVSSINGESDDDILPQTNLIHPNYHLRRLYSKCY